MTLHDKEYHGVSSIRKALKLRIKKHPKSIRQIALFLGEDQSVIVRQLNGNRKPSKRILKNLTEYLGGQWWDACITFDDE